MAKSRTKEIAREKTPQERVKDSYSYEKACNAAKNSGTPTYHFAVGDRVQVGHLPNCVVEEVMDDGAMYLIRVTTKNNVEYSCWAWTSVRPLDDDKDTHFAKRDSALSRLHYSNRSMYSLLSFHYLFGVDFKPDYQRGSVWDEEDREKLLDSIFAGREMLTANGCSYKRVVIKGEHQKTFNRIKVGAPGDWYEKSVGTPEEKDIRCGDCGAKIGYYHHYGCDIEKCPICGSQFLSCDCLENFDSAVLTI